MLALALLSLIPHTPIAHRIAQPPAKALFELRPVVARTAKGLKRTASGHSRPKGHRPGPEGWPLPWQDLHITQTQMNIPALQKEQNPAQRRSIPVAYGTAKTGSNRSWTPTPARLRPSVAPTGRALPGVHILVRKRQRRKDDKPQSPWQREAPRPLALVAHDRYLWQAQQRRIPGHQGRGSCKIGRNCRHLRVRTWRAPRHLLRGAGAEAAGTCSAVAQR
jgi:hypothetical protein